MEGKNVGILKISAPALKSLTITYPATKCRWASRPHSYLNLCDVFPYKIEVDAPSLLYIKAMKVLSSQLVEARIDFELCPKQCGDVYEKSLLELLEGISNVQTPHISGDCMQVSFIIFSCSRLRLFFTFV